jgi:hypothetical protein
LENIHFDLNFVDQMVDLMPFPIEGIQQWPLKKGGSCQCIEMNGWNGGGKATNKKYINYSSLIIKHDDVASLNIPWESFKTLVIGWPFRSLMAVVFF